jgi:hypothetical protein
MGMDIKQVESDIKSGKSKRIYLCSRTLWWTHLDSDVKYATAKGQQFQEITENKMRDDPSVPQEKKQKIRALRDGLKELYANNPKAFPGGGGVPLSPIGAPLYQNDKPMKFIQQTKMKPSHFGKHGLKAFMRTHHQNEQAHFYNKWDKYNDLIDEDNKLKIVK